MPSIEDPDALSAAVAGMEDDPELMAAYAEAQAELANMMPKKEEEEEKEQKGAARSRSSGA